MNGLFPTIYNVIIFNWSKGAVGVYKQVWNHVFDVAWILGEVIDELEKKKIVGIRLVGHNIGAHCAVVGITYKIKFSLQLLQISSNHYIYLH